MTSTVCFMVIYFKLHVFVCVSISDMICGKFSEMSGERGLGGDQLLSKMLAPGNKWRQRAEDRTREEKHETKKEEQDVIYVSVDC